MVGGNWRIVVQKETCTRYAVVKVVDLTIGTFIGGVFVDMHETDVIRGVARFEEGEKMLVAEVE